MANNRSDCSSATSRISAVVAILLVAVFLAGCGNGAQPVAVDTPEAAPLLIPPLLEPTIENGISYYDLTIGPSRHDYLPASRTDTYSYNGLPVLGPTLRLKSGASVGYQRN